MVDLGALAQNFSVLRERLAPSCAVIGIVKANAYGHGAVEVAEVLVRIGCSMLGVATVAEGIQLRDAGILSPVIVLGPVVPRELGDLLQHRLTPIVYEEAMLLALSERVKDVAPCPVHLEVETGMGRLGIPIDRVMPLLQSAAFRGAVRLEGMMTHFADAESADPAFARQQIDVFRDLIDRVRGAGIEVPLAHMANTAGILRYPDSHLDGVRPGIGLYGYWPGPSTTDDPALKPILSWSTHVVQIRPLQPGQTVSYGRTFRATRPSRVAVLPVGYADGYNRLLSNRASVLIHGRRAPVVGRVCMDMTMVDVTDVPESKTGDAVVLIGSQGRETITAQDVASWQGSISYEVLCAIGPRVRRSYTGLP